MHARCAVVVIAAIAACREPPPPDPVPPAGLAQVLQAAMGMDEATRARTVASWKLDRTAWDRTVVPRYAALYADYARAFDAAAPALVARLAVRGALTTRRHYAGDLRLTLGQARARWALPVMYPSEVAELDGVPLDAVFIRDGDHWHAIVGLDTVLRARVAALDPACATLLDRVGSKECTNASWVIADSVLATDRPRFTRACALASSLCAVVNRSP